MQNFINPENANTINGIALALLSLIGMGLVYLVYLIMRRVLGNQDLIAHAKYVTPFALSVLGLTAIGFAWADMPSSDDQKTLATKFLMQSGNESERREVMKVIAETEKINPGMFTQSPTYLVQTPTQENRKLPRACDGGLVGLGIGLFLTGMILLCVRDSRHQL